MCLPLFAFKTLKTQSKELKRGGRKRSVSSERGEHEDDSINDVMWEKRAESRHEDRPFAQLWTQLRQDNASLSNETWVKANVRCSSERRTRSL